LIDQLLGIRIWVISRGFCSRNDRLYRWLWRKGNVKISNVRYTYAFRLCHAINQRRNESRSAAHIELEKLTFCEHRHGLGFSELIYKSRIVGHIHAGQIGPDDFGRYVERLLTVEGKDEGKILNELPSVFRKPQAPRHIRADYHDNCDAAPVHRSCTARKELSVRVIGEGPAIPIANLD
jgi:hypothetical protein